MPERQLEFQFKNDETSDSSIDVHSCHEQKQKPSVIVDSTQQSALGFYDVINANRQLTYDGLPIDQWPDASCLNNSRSITIDRRQAGIDGPPHRFVVEVGDSVEVFRADKTSTVGEVVDVGHYKGEVCVQIDGCSSMEWFDIDRIYPTALIKKTRNRRKPQRVAEEKAVLAGKVNVNAVNRQIENRSSYTSLKTFALIRIGSIQHRPKITSTDEAVSFFSKYWEDYPGNDQERFVVACLDTKHRIQSVVEISRGTLDASLVHPREVFRPAVAEGSAAVLLSHNHPSGDPTPSREDHQVTTRLTEAGTLLGINVLDHVIYGDGTGSAISIREQ